jgi:hypothetical protein
VISRTVVTGRYCEHKFQIRKNEHALSAQTRIANSFRTASAYSSRHGEFTEIPVIAKICCVIRDGCGTKTRVQPKRSALAREFVLINATGYPIR